MNVALQIYDSLNNVNDLDNLIASREGENLHLDFKRKDNNSSPDLDKEIQVILSKAISGFANSEGGVLVFGIDTPRDGSVLKTPISDIQIFKLKVNEYLSRSTSFAVEGIKLKEIIENNNNGFLIIYIPESDMAPHRSIKDQRYYQRIGESFIPMEHYQIADIFGRRQRPKLEIYGELTGDINHNGKIILILGLKNVGKAIAKFPCLSVETIADFKFNSFGISGNRHFGLPTFPGATSYDNYRGGVNDVVQCLTKLPVTKLERHVQFDNINGILEGFDDLILGGTLAADEFPLKNWRLKLSKAKIQSVLIDKSTKVILTSEVY